MTQHPDLFAALAAPFDPSEVKVRAQSNRQLHYITARTAMNRLDEVLGPENWWDTYRPGENSVLCELTIRLPDGATITKSDAGGYAGMADSGDDDKSGFSDAFKRAAVKFGVARYLYRDGVPSFVRDRVPGVDVSVSGGGAANHTPSHNPPPAPGSSGERGSASATAVAAPPATERAASGKQPRTGKALFAWTREQEQRHSVGLLKYLNGWAKLQEYPGRMVDWDAEQVNNGYVEACRKLNAVVAGSTEAYEEALSN